MNIEKSLITLVRIEWEMGRTSFSNSSSEAALFNIFMEDYKTGNRLTGSAIIDMLVEKLGDDKERDALTGSLEIKWDDWRYAFKHMTVGERAEKYSTAVHLPEGLH